MPVPNTFGTATTSIPLSQLDANFNTPVTIGSTSVGLGNTVTTVANLTLTNATISSGNVTVTTGVFGAGSNTAPSITTTGDTNTGIFFPAADTIAFTEGGVESMRINSAGNLGIGTASPTGKLNVDGGAGNSKVKLSNTLSGNGSGDGFDLDFTGTDIYITNRENGFMAFENNGSERMRITSGGDLFVGSSAIIWDERIQGYVTTSRVVGGLYSLSSSYTSSVLRLQTETGGSRNWQLINGRRNGGAETFIVYGDGSIFSAGTIGVGGVTPSTSGTGITFPATQSASSDANTLDDYEEGTWTPTVFGSTTAGTYTITASNSRYRKIGSQVTVWGDVQFSAATGGAGNVRIGNLPFNYVSGTGAIPGILFIDTVNTTSASSLGSAVAATTGASSNEIFPFLFIDNSPTEQIPISGVSTSSRFAFTYIYTA